MHDGENGNEAPFAHGGWQVDGVDENRKYTGKQGAHRNPRVQTCYNNTYMPGMQNFGYRGFDLEQTSVDIEKRFQVRS